VNDTQNIVGIISIFVAFTLAIVAMWQNLRFKHMSDKYQENIDKYTKETNDKFLTIQNNIYNVQSQMLEISNMKDTPLLIPILDDYHTYNSKSITINKTCKIFVQGKEILFESYYFKSCKKFSVKNQGLSDILDLKIQNIRTVQHQNNKNEDVIIDIINKDIINEINPIHLNKDDICEFNISVPFSELLGCPSIDVYLKIEITNCLNKKYETEFCYKFFRDKMKLYEGPYYESEPSTTLRARLLEDDKEE